MNQRRTLLEVREDARGHTYVPNLLCVKVKSYKSVYQLIAKGGRVGGCSGWAGRRVGGRAYERVGQLSY